ncbi:MAG: thioredoxin family protein [Bacteroidetes bacterium]|jgi:thioredoxin 1|nr:thioredoxin family protein [Bacteroidota bacterium]MBT6687554.1 thioredoxin family protein [Bacteroidota bacterium]MBT7142785.1 thioredoxin family protein [Bacteroidota bacterium]MBT7491988.1 thioredoxin family protein [Bacteroidota bacterium]
MEWNLHNFPVVRESKAKINEKNKFEPEQFQNLLNSDSLIFIDFYAPWCAPCRKMMPMIDSLQIEYHNRIKIVKINSDASKKLIKKLQIVSVPYMILYHKKNIIFSKNGTIEKKDLQAIFDSQLRKLGSTAQ